ncbi:MAG: hypothetical protein ACPMAG_12200, partial [Limisphaerales bacterium]
FIRRIWESFELSEKLKDIDPELSDLHIWAGANLIGLSLAIYVGADLNAPIIWFFISLVVYFKRMAEKERDVEQALLAMSTSTDEPPPQEPVKNPAI